MGLRIGKEYAVNNVEAILPPGVEACIINHAYGEQYLVTHGCDPDTIRVLRRVGNPQTTPTGVASDPRGDSVC